MSKFSRQSLITKVVRAMDLASDPRTPENERAESARVAARLISRHQIEDAELRSTGQAGPTEIVTFTFEVSNLNKLGRERADALAWAAIHPFGGSSFRNWTPYASTPTWLRVFIREDLKEVVEVLLTMLHTQLMGLEKAATKKFVDEWAEDLGGWPHYLSPTASQRSQKALEFRRGYIPSWGRGVAARVRTGRKEAIAEAQQEKMAQAYAEGKDGAELHAIAGSVSTGMEVALRDDTAGTQAFLEKWYADQNNGGSLKPNRKQNSTIRVAADGERAGRKDARKTDIGLARIA